MMPYGQEILRAGRSLGRSPGFTVVAVAILALGIGTIVAVFSVADSLLLRPLPISDPASLVIFRQPAPNEPGRAGDALPYAFWAPLRDASDTFASVFVAEEPREYLLALMETGDGQPVWVENVSGSYFPTLGIAPSVGRFFDEDDDLPGGPPVAVVSEALWRRHFGADPAALGAVVRLENIVTMTAPLEIRIIGVAPPGFYGADLDVAVDIWLPYHVVNPEPDRMTTEPFVIRQVLMVRMMGRLHSTVTITAAQAEADVRYAQSDDQLLVRYRDEGGRILLDAGTAGYSELRFGFSQPLLILMVAAASVLLIVCANLAALLLGRGSLRRHELAVRLALGSSRFGLMRHLLAEAVLLAAAGGLLGLMIAQGGAQFLTGYLPPESGVRPRIGLNLRVTVFAAAVAIGAVSLFGLLPALRLSQSTSILARTIHRGGSHAHRRPHQWIVIGQVSVSLILLVVAALFIRTLQNLEELDPGYDAAGVVQVSIASVRQDSNWNEVSTRLLAGFSSISGVETVSRYRVSGILDDGGTAVTFTDFSRDPAMEGLRAAELQVDTAFFATLGIAMVDGEAFDPSAPGASPLNPPVVISERLAQRLFPDSNPIDHMLGAESGVLRESRIAGVAADARITNFPDAAPEVVYRPYTQSPVALTRFALRTDIAPATLRPILESIVQETNDRYRIATMQTMQEAAEAILARERLVARLTGFFAFFALLLAALGVYGVSSYAVIHRTSEIGLRMAVGAQPRDIAVMVWRETAWLLGLGIGFGLLGMLTATRVVAAHLYGVTPTDPISIATSILLLIAAFGLAVYFPARRAARLDPMAALRSE